MAHLPASKRYRPLSRYPGALRDLALIVDADSPSRAVQEVIESFPLVTSVELFDVYTGDQVVEGQEIVGVPGAVPVAEQDVRRA